MEFRRYNVPFITGFAGLAGPRQGKRQPPKSVSGAKPPVNAKRPNAAPLRSRREVLTTTQITNRITRRAARHRPSAVIARDIAALEKRIADGLARTPPVQASVAQTQKLTILYGEKAAALKQEKDAADLLASLRDGKPLPGAGNGNGNGNGTGNGNDTGTTTKSPPPGFYVNPATGRSEYWDGEKWIVPSVQDQSGNVIRTDTGVVPQGTTQTPQVVQPGDEIGPIRFSEGGSDVLYPDAAAQSGGVTVDPETGRLVYAETSSGISGKTVLVGAAVLGAILFMRSRKGRKAKGR